MKRNETHRWVLLFLFHGDPAKTVGGPYHYSSFRRMLTRDFWAKKWGGPLSLGGPLPTPTQSR